MDFNKALNIQDSNFESILELMKLQRDPEKVDSIRNLLLTVNLILDYFLSREGDCLKIPVVYFPECQPYSQELCEDFVCLKISFYRYNEWKKFLTQILKSDAMLIPTEVTTQIQKKQFRDNFVYEKKLCSILKKTVNDRKDEDITLLYSENIRKGFKEYKAAKKTWGNRTTNKYWHLARTVSSFKNMTDQCPLKVIDCEADGLEDSGDFYDTIVDNERNLRIKNIIVFPYKTADGRYSDFCSDFFQEPYLKDYAQETGLRNVIFFSFSKKPYKLRALFDYKQRMREQIQIQDEDSFEFITFSHEESLLLNGKEKDDHLILTVGEERNDIQNDYETLFDDITQGLEGQVSLRNEISLCITPQACNAYINDLTQTTESDKGLISAILNLNKTLWNDSIESAIRHFVYHSSVCVIIRENISYQLQNMFKELLIDKFQANTVKFEPFEKCDFDKITQKKILILSFRNDYTESIYHRYPNSFDPICINSDQQVMEIRNYFFMRQYYDWGKYRYGKALRKILKSEFRNTEMKPILAEYQRPTKQLSVETPEEELDRNTDRMAQQIHVITTSEIELSYLRSDWMLYKYNESLGLATMSDICAQHESYKNLQIQQLAPLVRHIHKYYIDSKIDKDSKSERMFKEQPLYGLSQAEIDSPVQLWKILLKKKVEETSEKHVYNEIMKNFNEHDVVAFSSFIKWKDPEYGIPRARKMQKFLIEDYLGIKPPYINLVRRIKERTKNKTEYIFASIRYFLNLALLSEDYSKVFSELNDEMKDLLDITSVDDIENMVNDINERIQFQPVKTIIQ